MQLYLFTFDFSVQSQAFREQLSQALGQILDPIRVLRTVLILLDVAEGSPENLAELGKVYPLPSMRGRFAVTPCILS